MKDINYVFFIGDDTDNKYIYRDLRFREDITVFTKNHFFGNRILDSCFRFCFSQKVNRKGSFPLKRCWFKIFAKKIKKSVTANNAVLVFQSGWYDKDLVQWLKIHFPRIKLAIFFGDTIGCYANAIPSLNPDKLNDLYDMVFCYNPDDVERYGFMYAPAYFSRIPRDEIEVDGVRYDISFVGLAKDRLPLIRDIKKKFDDAGIISQFMVGGVKKADRLNDGIIYLDKNISYLEYLSVVLKSECILELIKGDTAGSTLRCWEAVYYNKKLLTNWKGIFKFRFYDKNLMSYFDNVDNIALDFVKERVEIDFGYNNENSPLELVRKIETCLENN